MKRFLLVPFILLLPVPVFAQAERYELARRLRSFEAAWELQEDNAARQRAVSPLKQAATSFFSGRPNVAGKYLDEARFALASSEHPEPAVSWSESLTVYLTMRLGDRTTRDVGFKVEPFYEAGKQPEQLSVTFTLRRTDGKAKPLTTTVPLNSVPFEGKFSVADLPEGDYTLDIAFSHKDGKLARQEQTFSVVDKLSDRLGALKKALADWPEKTTQTERETARRLVQVLDDLAAKKTLETNYPAARLLVEAEAVVDMVAKEKPFYTAEKSGQFWLTLAAEKLSAPVRVLVPPEAAKGKPLPLVVGIHGVGGSENMFFDACGNGISVELCKKRGWFLVAPRSGFRGVKVKEIVEELARIYPIDPKRVFLVGHSMGAAQAVGAASDNPEKFAGVAALGGGGTFKATEAGKNVPFFVGIGKEDFALSGAKSLNDQLKKAELKKVVYKEYDIEHIAIVQLALRDVFAFYDEIVGTGK